MGNFLSTFNLKKKIKFIVIRKLLLLYILTFGKVSLRHNPINNKSATDRAKANIAGNQYHALTVLSANIANVAPIIGPTIKPNENAIPTSAIPLPRLAALETSVIMAILNDMLLLLRPPTNRAKANKAKFWETAQMA